MIIDGRKIAEEILTRAKARAACLPKAPLVVALTALETPATLSYLNIKRAKAIEAGCVFETRPLDAFCDDADAVIVQLPLPSGMDQRETCDAIPLLKDADVLSRPARAKFEKGEPDALLPPVVGTVAEIFESAQITPKGKRATVIGEGWLVGHPAAVWLNQQGADVSVVTSADDVSSALSGADIIVSGAGVPHLIKPEYVRRGVVLIDAGTSESGTPLSRLTLKIILPSYLVASGFMAISKFVQRDWLTYCSRNAGPTSAGHSS